MKRLRAILFTALAIAMVVLAVWGWLALSNHKAQGNEGQWNGVDKNVVEKYASEAGRPPSQPLINTGQGDMPLFIFAAGGAIGGFMAGYYWRKVISEKKKD